MVRIAFVGFRHAHIEEVYRLARRRDDMEIVAACEDDPGAREALASAGAVEITHAGSEEATGRCGKHRCEEQRQRSATKGLLRHCGLLLKPCAHAHHHPLPGE